MTGIFIEVVKLKNVILEKLKNDVEIVPATKQDVMDFVQKHYLQKFPAGIQLIYMVNYKTPDGSKPIGMAMYGSLMPAATKFLEPEVSHQECIELKRLFMDDDANKIPNLESFVIGQTIKRVKEDKPNIKIIITFADDKQGHKGTIYQATNAIYLGKSDAGKHKYVYVIRGNLDAIKAKLQPQPYPKKELSEILSTNIETPLERINRGYGYSFTIDNSNFSIEFRRVESVDDLEEFFHDYHDYTDLQDSISPEEMEDANIWSISLKQNPNDPNQFSKYKLTGNLKHKAVLVYNHVISAIKNFVISFKPNYVGIIAAETRQAELYTKLAAKFVGSLNYERLEKIPVLGGFTIDADAFLFVRKS